MQISGQGIQFTKTWEQYAPRPYRDEGGNWTWGYGHKQLPGEPLPAYVSTRDALTILEQDLHFAESAVNHHVISQLEQYQFDALVDFVFNVGVGAFFASTLLRDLNADDMVEAPTQIKRWVYVTVNGALVRSPGLIVRRNAEARLFSTGVYDAAH